MSTYDDPNREAVGQPPIWTGAEAEPKARSVRQSSTDETFDPGEHTVTEVEEYLAEHPDQYKAVMKAEARGKNRATLTGG